MRSEVHVYYDTFVTEIDSEPHAKCRKCKAGIYFYKSKKDKWSVLAPTGCIGDGMQVLDFHKCN